MSDFLAILDADRDETAITSHTIPVVGFAQAGEKGYFDTDGYPKGGSWNEIALPATANDGLYGIEVAGDSMKPLYRPGDTLIVDPTTRIRKNDRVVVKLKSGEVTVKTLTKKSDNECELKSLNPKHENRTVKTKDIVWMARVVWVSQ